MPRFFVCRDSVDTVNGKICIVGDDAHHIARSLRLAVGESITVCLTDTIPMEYICTLEAITDTRATALIIEEKEPSTEPPFVARIYQALPKGDKLDLIIQKAVECGVSSVTVFESSRCIAKSKGENEAKKTERRQRIAAEAAKQCGRAVIPKVNPTLSFAEMLAAASKADICLFCYEAAGTVPLGKVLKEFVHNGGQNKPPVISVVIGSEGGFSEEEAKRAADAGMILCGLGRRILRTETASSFVLSALVYEYELQ